jgi:ferric-dicitrate binding protein FerR (iron transport regulator)
MKSTLPAFALALALAGALAAAPDMAKPAGTVTSVSGKVSLIGADSSSKTLKLGQPVYPGNRIKTGANGRAQLVLSDGTQLKVNYLTDITLRDTDVKGKPSERGIGSVKIALGNLWAKVVKKNSRLEFETPAAVAAVKGTEPEFNVDEVGNLCVKLKEGALDLQSDFGAAKLEKLKQICIKKGAKFGQQDVGDWDGKGSLWLDVAGTAAGSASVTLKATDSDGQEKQLILDYDRK